MPVSYQSKTFESSPYVAPLDLNVMAKVLSYEQGKFDTKASAIQQQIDTLGNIDVMRGVDRQYVNAKVNGIVSNINGLGGVNLADDNVSGQIEGYATSLYNDDNIISAVASTKKIRALMSSYDKMKSDPKLMKYYSEANEDWDTKNVGKYLSDTKIGSSYSGPTTATPYYDYNTDFQKAFKDVIGRKNVVLGQNGMYISKETNEVFTADEIMASARELLTPKQREQMMRDGSFLYGTRLRFGKDQMIGKAVEYDNKKIAVEEERMKLLKNAIILEKDPKNKEQLTNAMTLSEQKVKLMKANVGNAKQSYGQLYDNNPTEMMYAVFSEEYFRGLGRRFQIYKEDKSLTPDAAKIAQMKESGQDRRLEATLKHQKGMLDLKYEKEKELETLKAQLKAEYGNGSGDGTDGTGGKKGPQSAALGYSTAEIESDKIQPYVDAANERLTQIDAEGSKAEEDFMTYLKQENPEIANYLVDNNKDGKVTIADFEGTDEKGMLRYSTLPTKASEVIGSALQAFERLSKGEPVAIKKFPKGIAELVEKRALMDEERKALKGLVTSAESGADKFVVPQYADKVYGVDDKTQNTLSIAKSYLIKHQGLSFKPEEINVLSINKKDTGKYAVSFQVGRGKSYENQTIEVGSDVARIFSISDGPYSVLNETVTVGNDFYMPVQNEFDHKFVNKIRVYKTQNGFNVTYQKFNPNTNQYIPYEFRNRDAGDFPSAASAYAFAKQAIQKYGLKYQAKERTNLKDKFEQIELAPVN